MKDHGRVALCIFMAIFLVLSLSWQVGATMICAKDLNANGTIEQDTERWQCRGSGSNYSCPYGAVECTSKSHTVSGSAVAPPTSISGKNAINTIQVVSGGSGINVLAWQCSSGGASCSSVTVGALAFSQGGVSGGCTADVITKVVGNGSMLQFYGCTGTTPCAGGGTLMGSIAVNGATFSGTVEAQDGILSMTSSGDGTQILFEGYICVTGAGCSTVSLGGITISGSTYSCPSGSSYSCIVDSSDGKSKCSTQPCFDDSVQGLTTDGKMCAADLSGNGIIEFDTEVNACLTVDGQDFCPLQAVNCTPVTTDSYCLSDGTTCTQGGTWDAENKRCEVSMVAGSYACYLINANYSTLGECQEKCKVTAACTSTDVSVSGKANFGQQGFTSVAGTGNTLVFSGGTISFVGCGFSGSVSGGTFDRIKVRDGKYLDVYATGDVLTAQGTITVSGCIASGEIYSPSGTGFTGVNAGTKALSGMWNDSQYVNGTSIYFDTDPAAGTGCLLGTTYPCTDGLCTQGGDCAPVEQCPAGYTKSSSNNKCYSSGTGATYTSTYDSVSGKCVVAKPCPDGYTYDEPNNVCWMTPPCPENSTYSTTLDKCIADPIIECPAGSTWNETRTKCEAAPAIGCREGSVWDSSLSKCATDVSCSSGGTLNVSLDVCQTDSSLTCAADTTYNTSTSKCEAVPTCSVGTYNTTYDKCTYASTVTCPVGMTWNATYNYCTAPPSITCSTGYTWNSTYNMCTVAASSTCPAGGTWNAAGYCQASPASSVAPSLTQPAWGSCSPSYLSASGTTLNRTGYSYDELGVHTCTGGIFGGNVPVSGTVSPAPVECFRGSTMLAWRLCNPTIVNGNQLCFYNCSTGAQLGCITFTSSSISGNYSSLTGWVQYMYWVNSTSFRLYVYKNVNSCNGWPAGGTLVGQMNITVGNVVICPSGYSLVSGTCRAAPCAGYTYDSATGLCKASATYNCPNGGTYSAAWGVCYSSPTNNCETGNYNTVWGQCYVDATCPSGTSLNGSLELCQGSVSTGCGAGYTLNSTTEKCEMTPPCTDSTYSASADKCLSDPTNTCVSGTSYNAELGLCQGDKITTCSIADFTFDSSVSLCTMTAPCTGAGSLNLLTDHCEILPGNGSCPSGYSWQASDATCISSPACVEGTYDAVQNKCLGSLACPHGTQFSCLLNPNSSTVQCSPNTCANLSSSIKESTADLTAYQNDGTSGSSGCQGVVYIFNGKGGECRPEGLQTLFMDCCDEKEDKLLFIKERCEDDEYRVAVQRNKRYCHFVGEYCKQKWEAKDRIGAWIVTSGFPGALPLMSDCLQPAQTYCCFSGILARIIHEQGRPQLKTSINDWGVAQAPNCRGFTTDEFAMLDFSRMDLSEYFTEITSTVTATVSQVSAAVKTKVEDYFNASIKK